MYWDCSCNHLLSCLANSVSFLFLIHSGCSHFIHFSIWFVEWISRGLLRSGQAWNFHLFMLSMWIMNHWFISLIVYIPGSVGPTGMRGATSLSAMLIVAWSTVLKGEQCPKLFLCLTSPFSSSLYPSLLSSLSFFRNWRQHRWCWAAFRNGQKDAGCWAACGCPFSLSCSCWSVPSLHFYSFMVINCIWALSPFMLAGISLPEGDPTNYMTFFRRATVYLAMGKSKSALPDLDKVIELKPDFTAVSDHCECFFQGFEDYETILIGLLVVCTGKVTKGQREDETGSSRWCHAGLPICAG